MALLAAASGPDLATFLICAVLAVVGAVGVVTSRNTVHAALMLIMTLVAVAVLFLEQDASFLAAVQVIVYAGAIVVLFLFVIMFLGVDRRENIEFEPLKGQRPLAFLLVVVAVAGILVLAGHAHWATGARAVAGSTNGPGSETAKLGRSVFTTYLFAFEITSALLVIAVVGAVVLARRPPGPSEDDGSPDAPAEMGTGSESGGPEELGAGGGDLEAGADEEPAVEEEVGS